MHFLCDMCLSYSNISFLVFLTFWIYSDAITDFQVLGRYFPFFKNILSVFRSSSAVSGLGPIEKLYLLKKGLRPLYQALVLYYKKKQKSGLCPLNQVLGCSRRGQLSSAMPRLSALLLVCIYQIKSFDYDKISGIYASKYPSKNMSKCSHFPRQVKHVHFLSISRQRETRKISSIISVTQRITRTRSSIFCYSIDINIYTRNLPVCNSGQHTYVTGLTFSLFFKI